MIPEVVKPLVASVASSLFGVGAWVLAQAPIFGDGLDIVGGSILVASAVVAFRMVLRAAAHERDAATQTESRLAKLAAGLETELESERRRSARLLLAYDRERHLRLALEAAGLTERRHNDAAGASQSDPLIDAADYRELRDVIETAGESLGDEADTP